VGEYSGSNSNCCFDFGKVAPKLDDVEKQLSLARVEIDAVSPNHYPPFFGGQKSVLN